MSSGKWTGLMSERCFHTLDNKGCWGDPEENYSLSTKDSFSFFVHIFLNLQKRCNIFFASKESLQNSKEL